MADLISRLAAFPAYGLGGVALLILYVLQSELRFGSHARSHRAGASDRNSTLVVSISSAFPVLGFALGMKAYSAGPASWLPVWFRQAVLPGRPFVAWAGVLLGVLGLGLRLWSVLTLRERYTRTLLVQTEQAIERSGPYRWVRHPGYLGSLLCLNGIALASGNWMVLFASLLATLAAYSYRIKAEDEMLVGALGPAYDEYRHQVRALLPFLRPSRRSGE